MTADSQLLENCIPRIIRWYARVRRPLPWREDPTPYQVWISEIMLQQTRIEAVLGYYDRFLRALPTVEALAAAEDDRLMKLWEGLGYYSRARNLKKAAVYLVEHCGGVLPQRAEELRALPGIGDYTAGAIASIAYGQPEPAVDGNVLRVVTRLLASGEDVADPRVRRRIAGLLRERYPSGRDAGLLTEGIMELGETVCVPNGEAKCALCPLTELCRACRAGAVDRYPVKSPPAPRRTEARTVLLLRCGDRFAIRRRTEGKLLAGMWEFPNLPGRLTAGEAAEKAADWGLRVLRCESAGEAKHVFTHIEWHMTGYLADCAGTNGDFLWRTAAEIRAAYPVPAAFRAYRDRLPESPALPEKE